MKIMTGENLSGKVNPSAVLAPPPQPPAVTAAQIAADTQLKLGIMKQQADQQTAQAEGQIAAAAHVLEGGKVQIAQQQMQVDATLKAHQLDMEHQRALMDYANRQKISLDQAKAELARTAMQLQTERDLNAVNNEHDMRKHRTPGAPKPPVQVPGRAANGQAFSQSPQ